MAETISNNPHVIVRGGAAGFAQQIQAGAHQLSADEPIESGGKDTGPSPYDLLLAALGSCTSMTIGLYARRRNWPLKEVVVSLWHSKIHAADCAECETREGRIDRIEREIELIGSLTNEQRSQLMEIADKCPVHRTLTSEINIRTKEKAAPSLKQS
ncbi:MAG TPA: OsmC family protein [Chthoniobacterales bacterium]|nr:OsmC family protein [Chthoniobacterales bacterium]